MNANDASLGKFGLDGSKVDAAYISGIGTVSSLAIVPVPEPSTSALLAGAGAFAVLLLRKRRNSAGA